MKIDELFSIGYISKTQGLKGEVQVYLEEDILESYFSNGMLFLEINGKAVPFFIETMRFQKSVAYFGFEDVSTIEEAAKLVGKKVLVPKKLRPKRKTGELTYKDLKGFFVTDEKEGDLGEISEVFEYPKQFVASILVNDTEVLLPLNEDIITGIDINNKKILVTMPDGLLDIYLGN
ncbi:ribosome maturation factor RimM [Solitalea sp. MAHUQ-68]|uniref:Ribosome maturation factor RimM n=1 Tax=Solitalea agri TaxID=2953739 RepID=A0A9X2F132_9SPHI|nr:ribosome maturation factor RimM [Solitalea agri]MCO4292742.1 ribosome maturation factor RimM [Solitalea agri]